MNNSDFEQYVLEQSFNEFCRSSCKEILRGTETSVKWVRSEIIYSDFDHSLIRFDGSEDECRYVVYFKVFHSENEDRYETVPVVLRKDRFIEIQDVEKAIEKVNE